MDNQTQEITYNRIMRNNTISKLAKPLQLTILCTRQVTHLSATIVVLQEPLELCDLLYWNIDMLRLFWILNEDTTSNSKKEA